MRLTQEQRDVLTSIREGPHTSKLIAATVDLTVAATHGCLRRLEDRNLVRRAGLDGREVILWELTYSGRQALEDSKAA